MSDTIDIARSLRLNVYRCWKCGSYWAAEMRHQHNIHSDSDCPCCGKERRQDLGKEADQLRRAVAALKGVVAKLKRRRR